MKYDIVCQPDFAMCNVDLEPEERIVVESGAMVAMSSNVKVETKARGGLLAGAKRKLLGGESFFINTYWPESDPGRIQLAPGTPGDMRAFDVDGRVLYIQSGAFVASSPSVALDTKWGGAKAFFGGKGLFFLKASGSGTVFISSFGAIHKVEVDGPYTVDTGHIVAFEDTLDFNVRSIGGLKAFLFSGEGLVCDFAGRGNLYLQTRSASAFAEFIHPFRPVKSSG